MWKIVVGFIVFAALSLFVIMKAGDKVDMSGEKHGADAVHAPEPAADVAAPPACAALALSAASKAGDTLATEAAGGQVPSTFSSAR